ncbi:hypothetical protein TSH100_05490 [Azospirillum sp. TSH100]|uniref:hypothetical protein n=1 Tax=Azospirillum sp. TSH100 TaxID=652764 RepID=UPI000D61C1C8|nr:hypothetical protein [Azospirillum sp. TSH100]PWC89087.1 hypothetical protein TSH100_05490 [Azospirillum sp. TSH100]QCG87122.1 hypothetical protein E6C72_04850 [Azospirillum sp. TSH100]
MSASRAEPRQPAGGARPGDVPQGAVPLLAGVLAGLLAASWAVVAAAQVAGPPIRLTPDAAVETAPSPRPPASVPALPVVPAYPPVVKPPPAVSPVVARPAPVAREPLGAPDPDGAGPLAGLQGLGGDPWRGIGRAELLPLIAALPVDTPSPTVKVLERRLLLSAGSPAVAIGEPPPPRRLGALRIEKLARLGDPAGAAELAGLLPAALAADEPAARALTDAELVRGGLDCPRALARGKSFVSAYWSKLALFCRARAGDRAGTDEALAGLRGGGRRSDSFLLVAEALAGAAPPSARSLSLEEDGDGLALLLAAMRTARIGVPPERLPLDKPPALAAIATNPAVDAATRAAAGERAAASLFLDARQLQDLYVQVPAVGDELLRVRDIARRDRGARTRALVHQAMVAAMDGRRRVALAALAVELVDPRLRAGPVGGAAAALLDSVSPTGDAAALAPAAARLYYAQGRLDQARRWQDLALRSGRSADTAWLWPLAVVATGQGAQDPHALTAWLDEALRGADSSARSRVAGQLALLQATGVSIPDETWMAATDGAGPPSGSDAGVDPALWQRLGDAAAGGRIGETVAVALLLLGEAGPATLPPVVTARVAANLKAVGLEPDARALVREAMAAIAGPSTPTSTAD